MTDNGSGGGCLNGLWMLVLVLVGAIIMQERTTPDITDDNAQTPDFPAVEVVLTPTETGVTWDELTAAHDSLDHRLGTLAAGGQIMGGYTLDSNLLDMTLVIRFSEGTASYEDVLDVLLESGYIEFVDLSAVEASALQGYEGQAIATSASVERTGDARGQIVFPTILTHEDIQQATATGMGAADGLGNMMVQIDLTPDGAARLGAFTEANIGSGLAVVLDGVVLTVPIIQGRVETPVIVTGDFTEAEVVALAAQINSRPLPIALTVQRVTQIGAP